jgi:hypothetical protein
MSRLQDLNRQAARAERLTACVTDALTIERLRAFASDCRRQIEQLTAQQAVAAWLARRGSAAPALWLAQHDRGGFNAVTASSSGRSLAPADCQPHPVRSVGRDRAPS